MRTRCTLLATQRLKAAVNICRCQALCLPQEQVVQLGCAQVPAHRNHKKTHGEPTRNRSLRATRFIDQIEIGRTNSNIESGAGEINAKKTKTRRNNLGNPGPHTFNVDHAGNKTTAQSFAFISPAKPPHQNTHSSTLSSRGQGEVCDFS